MNQPNIPEIFKSTLFSLSPDTEIDDKCLHDISALSDILKEKNIPVQDFLAKSAIEASQNSEHFKNRQNRNSINFITSNRPKKELSYTINSTDTWYLNSQDILQCVLNANKSIELIHDLSLIYGTEIFQILGMRNLSSFIGEVFAKEIRQHHTGKFISNPNQDGYPDLCALTKEGKQYIDEKTDENGVVDTNKSFWTPFPFGGIEVKATCGNTPPASKMRKPEIGESRLPIMVSAEWKAHHQETKLLLGILWDFVDGLPTVLSVFFRNDLDVTEGTGNKDWGAIVKPKSGGGRTTSVSIMKRGSNENEGVRKMGQGWLVLPENEDLQSPICRIFCVQIN